MKTHDEYNWEYSCSCGGYYDSGTNSCDCDCYFPVVTECSECGDLIEVEELEEPVFYEDWGGKPYPVCMKCFNLGQLNVAEDYAVNLFYKFNTENPDPLEIFAMMKFLESAS